MNNVNNNILQNKIDFLKEQKNLSEQLNCKENNDCRNFKNMIDVLEYQINNPNFSNNNKLFDGVYYHQNELDTCGQCGGYDGCLIGCNCPACNR